MFKQRLQLKLQQKLSPQQIQIIKLLEVPLSELDKRIKDELEKNPILEEVSHSEPLGPLSSSPNESEQFSNDSDTFDSTPTYRLYANNYSSGDELESSPLSAELGFQEFLNNQLSFTTLSEQEIKIGEQLIGNIDPDGYLRRNLSSIVNDLEFSQGLQCQVEEAQEVLKVIQDFDPPGVGARSLQDCLLLQLIRMPETPENVLATKIIRHYFDAFSKKHYYKITRGLSCDDALFKRAIQVILKLNPKPGSALTSESKNTGIITPDFILEFDSLGEMQLSLNDKHIPDLKINSEYSDMLEEYSKHRKGLSKAEQETTQFIRQKLDAARWFIDAIKQRQKTLLITMNAILRFQKTYFLEGDETKLVPMILKDISEMTGYDISTISRVSNSKYIYTPYGTFSLKFFFSEAMPTDSGDDVSSREIKFILNECLSKEDKSAPLTDDKLTLVLQKKGYHIARRTVAKYREQLNIPVARLRREFK